MAWFMSPAQSPTASGFGLAQTEEVLAGSMRCWRRRAATNPESSGANLVPHPPPGDEPGRLAWVDANNLPARACVEAKLASADALVEIAVIATK
jgi:hypothetical protein